MSSDPTNTVSLLSAGETTTLPVMLYDIPPRSGRKIDTATILQLAEVENIVAVKDAAGDVVETARLVAGAPEGFQIYSGEDALTLALLAVGAVGVVSVASHWVTPETVAMMEAFFSGEVIRATEMNQRLVESWDFESGDLKPNPIPTKAMLKALSNGSKKANSRKKRMMARGAGKATGGRRRK